VYSPTAIVLDPIDFGLHGPVMKKQLLLPLLLMAALGSAAAQPATNQVATQTHSETNSTTLDNLVTEALERNPEAKFYVAEIAAAKASRRTAGAWSNPELSTTVGIKTVRDRGTGMSGEGLAWSVSLAQPFEWPGRIGLRKAIANRDIELAELGLQRFRTALAGKVRSLAYGLFAAQQKAEAAREVAARFETLKEVLVQRDPAGLTPLLETRVIEATELSMQHKAAEAELAAKSALLEVNQLRGVALDAGVTLTPANLVFREAGTLEQLLAMARTNNFELRVRVVELAQQGFRVDLAKNERFPAVAVGPSFSEERAGDRERVFGVAVTMPLPLWNRNKGNIEAATARKMQAEVSLAVAYREVERKVAEAAVTYQAKLAEIGRWRPDAVSHFREAAELADRHYRLGAVPISTYVELQKQYLEAVEALLETRNKAMAAAQDLELLTGMSLPITQVQAKDAKP
jgi:cobalt-zinc-cadmium efflux system outer membrane protein